MSRQRQRRTEFTVSTNDPAHHFADPFQPQTPLGSLTPERTTSPLGARRPRVSPWLRWAVEPLEAFKLLLIPLVLYLNWELFTPQLETILEPLAPLIGPYLPNGHLSNPFGPIFLITHLVPTSDPDDPRYAKGWCDLLFIAYNIVFFSCFRQLVTVTLFRRIAKYFRIKKEAKLDRFGEQGYAVVYFAIFGAWGFRIMSQLPTYWYRTEYFWIGQRDAIVPHYPHWDMKPELKRYYLMQMAYWCQQLIVLVLGLEKPRKDFHELVAHHIVTLWLVGWSYFVNLTLIGNAIYTSMDIPDMFLAFSKLLNYIQWERAKIVSFVIFVGVWTYFRHYLNLVILWSVWNEFDLVPENAQRWEASEGTYLAGWMKYQVFIPIALLQMLNLFWYFLICRIIVRAIITVDVQDERSDDEGDDEEEEPAEKEKLKIKEKGTPIPVPKSKA
ncbi:longevity assurance proteins LAG1 LAC1 [Mycena maculata]|uniref:Longevity assurance proteins LAG1 LAC1 n=1 Tax=Mycena maculata TaxID=230809 RepID=A0AAD7NL38_9AGAR|nr:longevity assurance proteins LAG1 LAC1 [Mycena maculata]